MLSEDDLDKDKLYMEFQLPTTSLSKHMDIIEEDWARRSLMLIAATS